MEDPMSLMAYREVYEELSAKLSVDYPVPDSVDIAVVGNNTLLETSFRLRPIDKEPLEGVHNPGKSAHISFTRIPELACLAQLGRPLKREDRLYIIPAVHIRNIGFSPIYAPSHRCPLHVRLVPHRLDHEGDIPQGDRINLVNLLQGYQIRRNAK